MSTTPTLDSGIFGGIKKGYGGFNTSNPIMLKLKIPKGKGRGVYIENLSAINGEKEFLLKRGSKFKITKISRVLDKPCIEMEWIE